MPPQTLYGVAIVEAHVVEEPDRQVREELPRLRLVVRHRQAAVVADQHVIRVRRIDPDRVHVVVGRRGDVGAIVLPPSSVWCRPTPPR